MFMATGTTRDRIWSMALVRSAKDKPVYPEQVVELVGCSERTARDCLNEAANTPFLNRDVMRDGTVRYLPTARARGE